MALLNPVLTDAQLRAEIARCEFCEERACKAACPADCSPADFIMAAAVGEPSDFRRAAALIMTANPLGGVCGVLCPDTHCMAACSRAKVDRPVAIPSIQATIVARAKALGVMPRLPPPRSNGRRVAIVGAGPAGLAAAAMLARLGYAVTILERGPEAGGACRLVAGHRLPRDILDSDISWALSLGAIELKANAVVTDPGKLLADGFDGVVVAAGLTEPVALGVPGEEAAIHWDAYLADPASFDVKGLRVAVLGAGATAVDCAVTARLRGAAQVDLVARRAWAEFRLTDAERHELLDHRIGITGQTRVTAIRLEGGRVAGIETVRTRPAARGEAFERADAFDVAGTAAFRPDVDVVVEALGSRPSLPRVDDPRIVYGGDFATGATTVVTAVAGGKNAAAALDTAIQGHRPPAVRDPRKSVLVVPGYADRPAPLATDFFGRPLRSPFLLSAAPPTDGYDQMRLAFEAGWAGGVMKTAFDGVPIHIPGEYMHAFDGRTYGNCDNVSGHALERVCREVERLVREYPDRLVAASTGGPVTGDDEHDRRGWQSNTRKLDRAGAMAVEYSLSCPQGGDGTEGDIVSQNAAQAARIVDWVMEASEPSVPKLFKLTGAVTSIAVVVQALKGVFERHPHKKAGVTLANSFPTLAFRLGAKPEWEEGIVMGMSGAGVAPISFLTLSKVAHLGVFVSGNGGPMDYKAAAHFLAMGARNVQFCTVATRHGVGIVSELESGLSHLMAERGIRSVAELIGRALPRPVTAFPDLTPVKKVSQVRPELCASCGNCARCPYLAIALDDEKHPATDPSKCIGCSICVQKCMTGALYMRDRRPDEPAEPAH
jgi:NADPH-dependent glutamate synthase beta subunit-like oxidoreductase/dihydroorotate dehydrogenase/Pyruvate/2-oxoacid:ferredoxin oxidoreductase delta subunit